MKLGDAHLTYCTNIHPGESWGEVRANLERHTLGVKQRVSPDRPFGVGLRLSARAARELADRDALAELRRFLDKHDLYVFTINGFPYGDFHGTRVKEQVYRPDWHEPERIAYTRQLAELLAALLPDGVSGTISTVPLCFRERDGDRERLLASLARSVQDLVELEAATGKTITLALEPEPACLLETLDDAIAIVGASCGKHLGICLDACHAAVEFEDLARLRAHAMPIAKLQLSCGLRVTPVDADARRELARFADDVYLHQVVARRGTAFTRYVDLPEALAAPEPLDGRSSAAAGSTPEWECGEIDEWRIHFHVPIFREALGRFASTQPFLAELLAEQRRAAISTHLEVETYTWDVLPAEFRAEPIEDAIARELTWVMERLA